MTDVNTVADYVGEGKKYKSVEEALSSIPHAQTHISKLEADNKQLRESQQALQNKLESLLTNVNTGTMQSATPTATVAANNVDIEKLVRDALVKTQLEAQAQTNSNTVANKLRQIYADKAEVVYAERAQELGMSVDDLNILSARSPTAVLALFETPKQNNNNSIQGTVNPGIKGGTDTFESLMSVLTSDPQRYYSKQHQEKLREVVAKGLY